MTDERYRPDHSRRYHRLGSPCLMGPEPHLDNVCSLCGGPVPEGPLVLFNSVPRPDGDVDTWVYCDKCALKAIRP